MTEDDFVSRFLVSDFWSLAKNSADWAQHFDIHYSCFTIKKIKTKRYYICYLKATEPLCSRGRILFQWFHSYYRTGGLAL